MQRPCVLVTFLLTLWMFFASVNPAEAGYWIRTGSPVIVSRPETPNSRNLNYASNYVTTQVTTHIQGEQALIYWSWGTPPEVIVPGEIVSISLQYQVKDMVGSFWESNGGLSALFDVPNLAPGGVTSAAVQFVSLGISPKTEKAGMIRTATNSSIKAPLQSGDRSLYFGIGGAWSGPGFRCEYHYSWQEGTPPDGRTINTPTTQTPVPQQDQRLFYTGNDYGVANGGISPWFQANRPWQVNYIMTYHWNGGRGAPGGTIALIAENGAVYGPWQATVRNGVYWEVRPHITIPAGRYRIADSDPSTWAQNSQSNGLGHVIIDGVPQ